MIKSKTVIIKVMRKKKRMFQESIYWSKVWSNLSIMMIISRAVCLIIIAAIPTSILSKKAPCLIIIMVLIIMMIIRIINKKC